MANRGCSKDYKDTTHEEGLSWADGVCTTQKKTVRELASICREALFILFAWTVKGTWSKQKVPLPGLQGKGLHSSRSFKNQLKIGELHTFLLCLLL